MSNSADKDIIQKIKYQIQALINWEEQILTFLDNKSKIKKDILLYLIDSQWLKNYSLMFFSGNNKNMVYDFNKFELINNSKLTKEINNNSSFKILNKECWESLVRNKSKEIEIKLNGFIINNILLFMKKTHCFILYLYEQKLIKGYFKINDINEQQKVINYFESNFIINKLINNIFFDGNNMKMVKNEIYNIYFKHDKLSSQKMPAKGENNNLNYSLEQNNNDKINYTKKIKAQGSGKKNNYKTVNNNNNNYKKITNNKLDKNNDMFNPQLKVVKRYASANKRGIFKFKGLLDKHKNDVDVSSILPPKPIHKLSTPGVIGLRYNNGILCMNAVLQIFSNIPQLRNELLQENININNELAGNGANNKKIIFALAEVIKNLWKNLIQKIYDPQDFEKNINQINPYYQNNKWCEPPELIIFILDTIHNETNMPINMQLVNNMIIQNNNDFNYEFNKYKKNFENSNNSIISKLFVYFYSDIQKCKLSCNTQYKINNSKIINFNLDKIKKVINKNSIRIYEFFDYYQRKELIQLYCKCGNQIYKQSQLLYGPNILILNFNYGKETPNNKINIIYEENLNLGNYIYYNNNYNYELIGVICCLDNNSNNSNNSADKHYIAFCKNSNNNKWFKYNDNNVERVTFKEVCSCCQPCILVFNNNNYNNNSNNNK